MDRVTVTTKELESILSEISQIKEWIPQVVNNDVLNGYKAHFKLQQELMTLKTELKKQTVELNRWRNKYEACEASLKLEKGMQHKAKIQVAALKEQLSAEVQYCARLGASSCSLLWSLSKRGVPFSTLHTTSMKKFVETFEQTIVNFARADSRVDGDSDEMKFVESLCGTMTNISASEDGRDYIVESDSGKDLVSLLLPLLPSLTPRILKLILMFLYNISLHTNGLLILTKYPDVDTTLDRIICETCDVQVIVGALRLLQSLYCVNEEDVFVGRVSGKTVEKCLSYKHKEIREMARLLFERGGVSATHEL